MAFRMAKKARSLGAKIVTGKAVQKILVDQAKGQADGVLLADGTEVFCDYVVPACDMSVTFGRLLPREKMGSLLRQMYEDQRAYPVYNTFQTAMAVDSPRHSGAWKK